MKAVFLISIVFSLLGIGLAIALRGGVSGSAGGRGPGVFLGRLSVLLVRLLGYVAGLLLLHQVAGAPSLLSW